MAYSKTTIFAAAIIAAIALGWSGGAIAQAPGGDAPNAAGYWHGTRSATGGGGSDAFKTHSIAFDLTQNGTNLSGTYKCYAGKKANTPCNNPDGNLTGKLEDGNVRMQVVAQPNTIQCSFQGALTGNKMKGVFTCYADGGLDTNGSWTVHRDAAPAGSHE